MYNPILDNIHYGGVFLLFYEILKLIIHSFFIVVISKFILSSTLRKLAEALNLSAKSVGSITGYATSVPELLTITASSIRGYSRSKYF